MNICDKCKDFESNKPTKRIRCEFATDNKSAWGYMPGGFTKDLCEDCRKALFALIANFFKEGEKNSGS